MRPPDLFIGQVVFRTDIALMREARFSLRCLSEFLPLTDQPDYAWIPRLACPRSVALVVEFLDNLAITDDQATLTRPTLADDLLDHLTLFRSVSVRFPTGLSHRYLFPIGCPQLISVRVSLYECFDSRLDMPRQFPPSLYEYGEIRILGGFWRAACVGFCAATFRNRDF